MAKKPLTLPKLKKKAQEVFNKFIRLRDSSNGYFKCIACSNIKSVDQMNAGHYYAVKGYDGLRFDEDNVSGECAGCNCFDESHLIGYTENLKIKLGEVRYRQLQIRAKEYKMNGYKWTRSELENIIRWYKDEIKKLEDDW